MTAEPAILEGYVGTTLRLLAESGVQYCVLRGLDQSFAELIEIDLLVPASAIPDLWIVLRKMEFGKLLKSGHEPHHFFVGYDRPNRRWVKLDVVTELRYGAEIRFLPVAAVAEIMNRRVTRSGVFVPCPEDEFLTLTLHCVLDKGRFRQEHQARLEELAALIRADTLKFRGVQDQFRRSIPEPFAEYFTKSVYEQRWDTLLTQSRRLAAILFMQNPSCALFWARSWLRRRVRRFLTLFHVPGVMVALLAPDGAGKTTLAEGLAHDPYIRAMRVYMGSNLEADSVRLRPLRWLRTWLERRPLERRTNIGFRMLSYLSKLVEHTSRLAVAYFGKLLGRFVIFDRYIHDSLDWSTLPNKARWHTRLLRFGASLPDLIIVLDAPGDVLHQRKHEHTPELLEMQRYRYRNLAYTQQVRVVDAVRSAEEVRADVTALVWSFYSGRCAS